MKKYLLILSILISSTITAFAQEGENDERGGKLQQRMSQYIQKRLHLSRNEADRFSPVFLRYISQLRKIHRDNPTDMPLRQLEIAKLRIQYRNEFRQIFDEERANKVFNYELEFQEKIRDELKNRRLENRTNPNRRFRSVIQ